jgi:hypothetical protein
MNVLWSDILVNCFVTGDFIDVIVYQKVLKDIVSVESGGVIWCFLMGFT